MRDRLRSLRFVIATAFRADPWRAALASALTPASGLAMVGAGLWLKLMADAAADHRPRLALLAAAALAATFSLENFAKLSLVKLRFRLQEKTGLLLEQRLVELAAGLPGLEHHERPEYLDRLEHLRAERATLSQAIGSVLMTCSVAIQVLGTAGLLISVDPVLLLLPLLGLPSMMTSARSAAVMDRAKHATAEQNRLASQYLTMATSAGAAKEIRLFGLGHEILHRHRSLAEAIVRVRVRARLVSTMWESAGGLLFVVGYIAAIAFVIREATLGRATVGDVFLALRLAGQVGGMVDVVASMVGSLQSVLLVAGHFLWFVDQAAQERDGGSLPPERLHHGIALRDVSFRYPDTETDVLRNVNLLLPARTVVALVGDNGAGKSTLVKLLCGFYQPSEGRISVDGVDLRDIALDKWRDMLSGAFQDFCKFEFIAQETIGIGGLPNIENPAVVREAAEQAGAAPVLETLPNGLATQLGRTFQGTDLSQGQWQKLALARSRMRQQPLLYILDEPTSNLDAASEHELFSQIIESARKTTSHGAITLLVSHRLSTVRAADLIVVLREGEVAEVGTHADLMEIPGLYAELFTLQSSAYQ